MGKGVWRPEGGRQGITSPRYRKGVRLRQGSCGRNAGDSGHGVEGRGDVGGGAGGGGAGDGEMVIKLVSVVIMVAAGVG